MRRLLTLLIFLLAAPLAFAVIPIRDDVYVTGTLRLYNNKGIVGTTSGGAKRGVLVMNSANEVQLGHTSHLLELNSTTIPLTINYQATSCWLWDSCSDGSGSNLDADLLDGFDSTDFALAADAITALTGDVAATGPGSVVATIQANAVALGTDTTGNYVASLVAGTNISVGAAGEGATPTVGITGEIADGNIADNITASNYLPLTGGTVTGELNVTAPTTGTGYDEGAFNIKTPFGSVSGHTAFGIMNDSSDLLQVTNAGNLKVAQNIESVGGVFTGDGSGLDTLNASNIASGSLDDARLSSNVPLKNAANVFTAAQEVERTNIANTSTDGLIAENSQAATVGVPVQRSPRARFSGAFWRTVSGGSSRASDWYIENLPVTGLTGSSGLSFASQEAGGGYTERMNISSLNTLGPVGLTWGGAVLTTAKLPTDLTMVNGGAIASTVAGTGAGTGPTITIGANGVDGAHILNVTTGTGTPAADATIVTVTYAVAATNDSVVVISPNNKATRALAVTVAPFPVGAAANYVLTSNGTGLATSTAYSWNVIVRKL